MDPVTRTKQFYNKNATSWAERKHNSFYHEKAFLKYIKYFKKGNSIIDIGCANGIHVPLFLGIGRHLKYEGLDISKGLLKMARSRYPQLKFSEASILDREMLPKKKFDGFWSSSTLMHIPVEDWPVMLENIERMIRSKGVGYLSLPSRRPNPESDSDRRYFSLFTVDKFRKLVEPRGWKILQKGKYTATGPISSDWHWFIVRLP